MDSIFRVNKKCYFDPKLTDLFICKFSGKKPLLIIILLDSNIPEK